MSKHFFPGDIVHLKSGYAHSRVTHVHPLLPLLRCRYLSCTSMQEPSPYRSFDHFSHVIQEPVPTMYLPRIFALKSDQTAIGTVLGHNSLGLALFELRANLQVLIIPDSEIEEVRPFTFKTHRGEHFAASPAQVTVNDILIIGNTLHQVTQLDTRAPHYNPLPASTRKIPTLEL